MNDVRGKAVSEKRAKYCGSCAVWNWIALFSDENMDLMSGIVYIWSHMNGLVFRVSPWLNMMLGQHKIA